MHVCTFLSDKLSKVRRAARQQLLVVDIFECESTPKMDIPDDLIGRPGLADLCHRCLADILDSLMSCTDMIPQSRSL